MPRPLYILIAAIIAMVAVPVSQLRTVSVRVECCCPDPANCHCPDDAKPAPGQPTMRPCHRSSELAITSLLPEFDPPRAAVADAPARRVTTVVFALRLPHAPPGPARPAAPS